MAKDNKPGFHLHLQKHYPELLTALDALGEAARKAGPLDEKTVHLIQLAGAAAMRSEGAVHSHTRRALDAGATREEVLHAVVALTSTIGFPNVAAAFSWVEDVLNRRAGRVKAEGG